MAVLLGADPARAASDLKESLTFEIKLANASLPRELRRDATKLYHAMQLKDVNEIGPFISNWTNFVNNILTEDVIQVTYQWSLNIWFFCAFTLATTSYHAHQIDRLNELKGSKSIWPGPGRFFP